NPQRADGPKASAADRMAMCTLAFDGLADTVVLPIEMDRDGASFTIDTVREVQRMQEEGGVMKGPLRLVVGSDQALNFSTWKNWRDLVDLATPVVILRPPHTRAEWPAILAQHMDEAWAAKWLSWTLLRKRVAEGTDLGDLVLPAVGNYIASRGLYAKS
ncbi:MAG: nicotinate-nicotinamide nucleotide adenylyltransferase, partial [Proteobacteria bacterium]|nr:nicotinate-nicotinamide nucleotide adenylyltransferase [Pseudomonadota bacterium]